jgi:hypothetical protein
MLEPKVPGSSRGLGVPDRGPVWCAQSRRFSSPTSSGSSNWVSAADESTSATSVKPDVSRDMAAEKWLQMRLFVDCRTLREPSWCWHQQFRWVLTSTGQRWGVTCTPSRGQKKKFSCQVKSSQVNQSPFVARGPLETWAKNGVVWCMPQ